MLEPTTVDSTGDSLAALELSQLPGWRAAQTTEAQAGDSATERQIQEAARLVMGTDWLLEQLGLFYGLDIVADQLELTQHVAWLLQQRHPLIGSPEATVREALAEMSHLVEENELWSIVIAWDALTWVSHCFPLGLLRGLCLFGGCPKCGSRGARCSS